MVVSSDRQSKRGDKIPHKKFQVPFKPGFLEETLIRPALEGNKHMIGWNAYKLHLTMCESLLNSTELLEELKDFDLIVYDSFGPCAVLLSDLLRFPKVAISIPGGGTLGISGWGCAAGSLEPLTFTRASSAEFCYPILE